MALYTILAFGWTTENSVLYQSIFMGTVGVSVLAVNTAYIVFDLRRRYVSRWFTEMACRHLPNPYSVQY